MPPTSFTQQLAQNNPTSASVVHTTGRFPTTLELNRVLDVITSITVRTEAALEDSTDAR